MPQGHLIPNYTDHWRLMQSKKEKEPVSFIEVLVKTLESSEKLIWVAPSQLGTSLGLFK